MRITSNKSKRTYTIHYNGGKFTTGRLQRVEFEELSHNTDKDWHNYLHTNQF